MKQKLLFLLTVLILITGRVNAQHPWSVGTGVQSDPFQISSPADLKTLSDEINIGNYNTSYFMLMSDISLKAYSGSTGWTPIGNDTDMFDGYFNGNGKTITNLTINDPGGISSGLFGYVGPSGKIENLSVKSSDFGIDGLLFIGGIAGVNEGLINDCIFDGNISGVMAAGGLVGGNYGTIKNSNTSGVIFSNGDGVGGFVGENEGTIEYCFSTTSITGISAHASGFAGYNIPGAFIKYCFSTGSVNGSSKTGGFVGTNENATIEYCYSTGSVNSTLFYYAGGFAGSNELSGTIRSCYSTGSVNGVNNTGGFIGLNDGSNIQLCYSTGSVNGTALTSGFASEIASGATISNCYAMPYIDGVGDSIYIASPTPNALPIVGLNDELTGLRGRLASLPSGIWGVSPNNYPYLKEPYLPVHTLAVQDLPELSIRVNHGVAANEILSPKRHGYDFIDGWFASPGSTKYNFTNLVTKDMTLYAQWYLIPVLIHEHPHGAVVCPNVDGMHTIRVNASGVDLSYQWYKDGKLIPDATKSYYDISNIGNGFSADYRVLVSGFAGTVPSMTVNVRAVIPLPSVLEFNEVPIGVLSTKNDYTFSVKEYIDVDECIWSSSSGSVILSSTNGKSITARFTTIGPDTIHATLVHGCTIGYGFRTLSFPVVVEAATDIEGIENSSLTAYPNPTSGVVTVTGLTENEDIRLYNISGGQVRIYRSTGTTMSLDISDLPKGIYFLRTNTGSVKVIKD